MHYRLFASRHSGIFNADVDHTTAAPLAGKLRPTPHSYIVEVPLNLLHAGFMHICLRFRICAWVAM